MLKWKPKYNQEDFDFLWENCIFVFDTNMLLNFHRYSNSTNKDFFNVLTRVKDRLWIPHQVLLEYMYNQESVQIGLKNSYSKIDSAFKKIFNPALEEAKKELKQYKNHPFIETSEIVFKLEGVLSDFYQILQNTEEIHEIEVEQRGKLENSILDLFINVGKAFTEEELKRVIQSGQERYKILRPPGYEDRHKKDEEWKQYDNLIVPDKYGDLVAWKQIILHAKVIKQPVVFITDDQKQDWWRILKGRTLGPRVELIDEFSLEVELDASTPLPFYIYTGDMFLLQAARRFLNKEVINSVEEAREVRLNKDENNYAQLTDDQEKHIAYLIEIAKGKNSDLSKIAKEKFDEYLYLFSGDIGNGYLLIDLYRDLNSLIDWLEMKLKEEN
ncbi:PIN-like domain-containing protein [Paenibacillus rhizoplanae]|uniref:PIN-like domain-containing protein n=2 Tax=Paenibacillus rhizoplanae TaxID=1917181 RepID=A0ABW5F7B4_9BACL